MKELLHRGVSLSRSVQMTFPVHVQIPQYSYHPFPSHVKENVASTDPSSYSPLNVNAKENVTQRTCYSATIDFLPRPVQP